MNIRARTRFGRLRWGYARTGVALEIDRRYAQLLAELARATQQNPDRLIEWALLEHWRGIVAGSNTAYLDHAQTVPGDHPLSDAQLRKIARSSGFYPPTKHDMAQRAAVRAMFTPQPSLRKSRTVP